jgi:hypothetical protein
MEVKEIKALVKVCFPAKVRNAVIIGFYGFMASIVATQNITINNVVAGLIAGGFAMATELITAYKLEVPKSKKGNISTFFFTGGC